LISRSIMIRRLLTGSLTCPSPAVSRIIRLLTDVDASDPNPGHDLSLSYSLSPIINNLSFDSNGVLTGEARMPAGLYPTTLIVRDQYYDLTVPNSLAQAQRSIPLQVVDYDFDDYPAG
jgi:hypothetical protein